MPAHSPASPTCLHNHAPSNDNHPVHLSYQYTVRPHSCGGRGRGPTSPEFPKPRGERGFCEAWDLLDDNTKPNRRLLSSLRLSSSSRMGGCGGGAYEDTNREGSTESGPYPCPPHQSPCMCSDGVSPSDENHAPIIGCRELHGVRIVFARAPFPIPSNLAMKTTRRLHPRVSHASASGHAFALKPIDDFITLDLSHQR